MGLTVLDGRIVFSATDGDVALVLMVSDGRGAIVLMDNGGVKRVILNDKYDVDLVIGGLQKLEEELEEHASRKPEGVPRKKERDSDEW